MIGIHFYCRKELVGYKQWSACPRKDDSVRLHDGLFVVVDVIWYAPDGLGAENVDCAARVEVRAKPLTGGIG